MLSYLIDTHCHLHDHEWFSAEQQTDFIAEAKENDVRKIICIGTSPEDSFNARDFALRHEGIYWTYGIHPEFASEISSAEIQTSITNLRQNSEKLVAIGEVGLDYHYDGYSREAQIRLFEQMLQLAQDLDLPVSLHIREAFEDLWPILDNFSQIRGVVHSFTGSKKCLKNALGRGFYIGVNGLATYTTLPLPPLEKIVLETDAPFLTPVPFRGKMNQPRYVRLVATYLSEKMGVAEEIIVEQTTKNARKLFSFRGATSESGFCV